MQKHPAPVDSCLNIYLPQRLQGREGRERGRGHGGKKAILSNQLELLPNENNALLKAGSL